MEGKLLGGVPVDYLAPDVPPRLPWHAVPVVPADDRAVAPFGRLVDDPRAVDIEIVPWPAQGWRPVDAGTGDQGGVVEGVFHSEWRGAVLHGRNDAVDGDYVLGWSVDPAEADGAIAAGPPPRVLLWHLNYHPDGGQLFFPLDAQPFVVPVAPPGDDLRPDKVIALYCDGRRGLYIHPNIWHEGVFPTGGAQSFVDRQGRVHARVSCNVAREFGVFLDVPLARPGATVSPD